MCIRACEESEYCGDAWLVIGYRKRSPDTIYGSALHLRSIEAFATVLALVCTLIVVCTQMSTTASCKRSIGMAYVT
jgi:hypothetical protein